MWTIIAVEIADATHPADLRRMILQELSLYLAAQLFIEFTHSGCPECNSLKFERLSASSPQA